MLQKNRHIGSTLRSLVAAGPNGAGVIGTAVGAGDTIATLSP
jgi:Na+-transporting methylmalonyl-CoA/oxaloacetate decarboxylase beta subunit